MDKDAAVSKYGKNNTTKHTADVDHIIPAETVYERTQNNAFLSTKDIKEIKKLFYQTISNDILFKRDFE